MILKPAKYAKHIYPFRKNKFADEFIVDNSTDILYQGPTHVEWVVSHSNQVSNYREVPYDKAAVWQYFKCQCPKISTTAWAREIIMPTSYCSCKLKMTR